jgi:hypothetical protein
MASRAADASDAAVEIGPVAFLAGIDARPGSGRMRCGKPSCGMRDRRRLVIRRATAPGKHGKTNEKQEAKPSYRHYL